CCELERRDWELERRPGSAKVLSECILRSSGRLAARAGCCELERRDWELEQRPGSAKVLSECILRSSGRLAARAGVCEWPLEREEEIGDVLRGLGEDRGCTSKPDRYRKHATSKDIAGRLVAGIETQNLVVERRKEQPGLNLSSLFEKKMVHPELKLQGEKTGRKGHLSVVTEFYKSFATGLKDIVWKSGDETKEEANDGQYTVVSRLGFECRGLSRILNAPLSHEAGCSILKEAFHKGITFFDTTDVYGQKHDNKIMIGKLPREQVQLATKCGIISVDWTHVEVKGTPDYVRQCCEASLNQLDVDYMPTTEEGNGGVFLKNVAKCRHDCVKDNSFNVHS
ncbi:hypothetical protein HYC85_003209, partial [Camellia sinensis]